LNAKGELSEALCAFVVLAPERAFISWASFSPRFMQESQEFCADGVPEQMASIYISFFEA